METLYCPYCDYEMTEEEIDQVCDCGCPSCRRIYDVVDYIEDE